MSRFGGCGAIVVAMVLIANACSSQGDGGKSIVPGTGGTSGTGLGGRAVGGEAGYDTGQGGAGGTGIAGNGGGGAGGQHPGSLVDAGACCPPDPLPITSNSVHMGGATAQGGVCYVTSYFYLSCVTNWRVETDDQGCPILRVDYLDCPQSRNDARLPLDASDGDARDAD